MEQKAQAKLRPRKAKRIRELRVYRSWCKRCGICVGFCPKQALERDQVGYPRWRDQNACVLCRLCEFRCPDFAIEVLGEEGGRDEPEQ